MHFLGSNFTQNALAAEALGLGKLKRSPRPLADFRGLLCGRGKGNEGKDGGEKGVLGKGKREGREGKRGGRERGRRREREGRGVCVIGVRDDRRHCLQLHVKSNYNVCLCGTTTSCQVYEFALSFVKYNFSKKNFIVRVLYSYI